MSLEHGMVVFILTVSLSFVGLFSTGLEHRGLLIAGWISLGGCLFCNWILVKRPVTILVMKTTPVTNQDFLHRLSVSTIRDIRAYGFAQNAAFALGMSLIALALIPNMG